MPVVAAMRLIAKVPLVLPWLFKESFYFLQTQDTPLCLNTSNRRDLRYRLDNLLAQGYFQDDLEGREDVIHHTRRESRGSEFYSEILDSFCIDVLGFQLAKRRDNVVVEVRLLVVSVAFPYLLASEEEILDVGSFPVEKVFGEVTESYILFGDHQAMCKIVDCLGFGCGFRALP